MALKSKFLDLPEVPRIDSLHPFTPPNARNNSTLSSLRLISSFVLTWTISPLARSNRNNAHFKRAPTVLATSRGPVVEASLMCIQSISEDKGYRGWEWEEFEGQSEVMRGVGLQPLVGLLRLAA